MKVRLLLVLLAYVVGTCEPCKESPGPVCDLLDCSKCLEGCTIAVQFWEIHCIGYYVLPGPIRFWWLRGTIICPACWPWTYSESDGGPLERLEVKFTKFCHTCAIRGYLPVGHTCECGVPAHFSPIMTPSIIRLYTSHNKPLSILLEAFDPDGDLMGINWDGPIHGKLQGGPWLVALPAYSLSSRSRTYLRRTAGLGVIVSWLGHMMLQEIRRLK